MKHKQQIVSYNQFKHLVEEFAIDNFEADGCKECHENCYGLVAQDHKGSFDLALKELYISLLK